MKKYLPHIFLLLSSFVANSQQNVNNIWTFGKYAGVDFNSGSPVAIMDSITAREGSATICDRDGQILFYTNGSKVYDRNHDIMPNGNNLTGLPLIAGTEDPTESTTQGTLIVPMPDSVNKYYVFSLTSLEQGVNFGLLYYSVVNMDMNGGLGDVEAGRKGIKIDSGLSEKMIAVVGNRCNIWLLVHNANRVRSGPPEFKAYEINNSGINLTPVISQCGTYQTRLNYTLGVLKVSPDRKKLVTCNAMGGQGAELYDFDASTGIVSNNILLNAQQYYGACFSPDNSKLYISATGATKIYQYDISSGVASTIINSQVSITDSSSSVGTDLKLGPDGKIYFIPSFSSQYLSAINYPDLPGLACQVVNRAVPLLARTETVYGLPNENPVFVRDTTPSNTYHIKACFRDSVILYANDSGWDYTWDDKSDETYRSIYKSGKYIVSYHTIPCVLHIDTFDVEIVNHLPDIGAITGCNGAFSYLWILPDSLDGRVFTYTWRDTGGNILQMYTGAHGDTLRNISPGVYYVNMSGGGCDTTFRIQMPSSAYTISFVADTPVCLGDSVHFTNTSHGGLMYKWYFGDGDSSVDANPVHLYLRPGVYQVHLVGYQCMDTANIAVAVDSTPYVSFVVDSTPVCIGKAINFSSVYQSNATNLVWDFGDGSPLLSGWQPTYDYSTGGEKVVTLTAHFRACADTSFRDTLMVYDYPVVNIGADTSICEGSVLRLHNHVGQPEGYSYLWSTGNTTKSIDIIKPSVYWLRVVTDHGCTTTDTIAVDNDCYIAIPNAFTPNGDGVNDYFFPRELLSNGVAKFHMSIYSRWGVLLFETDNISGRGWAGVGNGVKQPEGVYIYLVEVGFINGTHQQYKGNITLIR